MCLRIIGASSKTSRKPPSVVSSESSTSLESNCGKLCGINITLVVLKTVIRLQQLPCHRYFKMPRQPNAYQHARSRRVRHDLHYYPEQGRRVLEQRPHRDSISTLRQPTGDAYQRAGRGISIISGEECATKASRLPSRVGGGATKCSTTACTRRVRAAVLA